MSRFLLAFSLLFIYCVAPAQSYPSITSPVLHFKSQYLGWYLLENNILNQVKISLDKTNNAIVFNCPKPIDKVRVIVKHRGEVIIAKMDDATISSNFKVMFPPNAPSLRYTIILQRDNHILVERLDKTW